MSILKNTALVTTALAGWLGAAACAHAQAINYGALEDMFGEPVTTSATGSPLKASQAPADMQIITANEIRRSGATNIPDILRYVAGIDVRTYGVADSDVSIRGYSQPYNPRLLVLINGRQVYLDDYGYTAWNILPVQLADIRQIEIVRGPESALFGFNAASGVINIITYDPLFDRVNTLNFGVGTDGTWVGSLVSTLNIPGKGGVTVQIGGVKANQYSLRTLPSYLGPYVARSQYGSYAVDGRYKPTNETEVTLEITQSQQDGITENPTYSYFRVPYRNSSIKTGFSWASPIGVLSLLGYINEEKVTSSSATTTSSWTANQVGVLQINDLFKADNNKTFKVGFEFRNNRESGQAIYGSLHYNDIAGHVMWNWQINPELSFTAAGRVDHLALSRVDPTVSYSKYTASDYQHANFTAESYNFGLVWAPTDYDTIRLLVGRGIQAPSLIAYGLESQSQESGLTVVYAGNPYLKPTITDNYEVDYDRHIGAIDSTLRTALFFDTTRDILQSAVSLPSSFSNGVLQSYSENIGKSESMGGEITLKGQDQSGWRWNVSYSLVGVRDKLNYGPPSSPVGWNNATPTSMIDFGLGYSMNKWEFDLNGHWQSNYKDVIYNIGPNGIFFTPKTIHNYITMSGRIGYQLTPAITLAVMGQQLTGATITETAGMRPQRRVLFMTTLKY